MTLSGGGRKQITLPGLGLIDQPYESDATLPDAGQKPGQYTNWERFAHYLDFLNKRDKGKFTYKLIYAARHGQGYHNVKEAEVGTKEWEVLLFFSFLLFLFFFPLLYFFLTRPLLPFFSY